MFLVLESCVLIRWMSISIPQAHLWNTLETLLAPFSVSFSGCSWSDWSVWSECSSSCGEGSIKRHGSQVTSDNAKLDCFCLKCFFQVHKRIDGSHFLPFFPPKDVLGAAS